MDVARVDKRSVPPDAVNELSVGDLLSLLRLLSETKVLEERIHLVTRMSIPCPSADINVKSMIAVTLSERNVYTSVEDCEWRTSIVMCATELVEFANLDGIGSYINLATEATIWCTEKVLTNDVESHHWDNLHSSSVAKLQTAAIALDRLIFSEANRLSCTEVQPVDAQLETLLSNCFNLIKAIYVSTISNQVPEGDLLRKACRELLSTAIPVIYSFRLLVNQDTAVTYPSKTANQAQIQKCLSAPQQRVTLLVVAPTEFSAQEMPVALRVVASSVRSLAELGNLSTGWGQNGYGLLNLSWKSVAALLQMRRGKEMLFDLIDIQAIIAALLSHAQQSLEQAKEAWLSQSSVDQGIARNDDRKLCIPIKFFLLIALRLSASYPLHGLVLGENIVSCSSEILSLLFSLSENSPTTKAAAEALAEIVVPTVISLWVDLVGSAEVDLDLKSNLLKQLIYEVQSPGGPKLGGEIDCHAKLHPLEKYTFKTSIVGRVALYLILLERATDLDEFLILELSKALPWLLGALSQDEVYVLILQEKVLPFYEGGKCSWTWQLAYLWVMNTVKVFFCIVAPFEDIWPFLEQFLFSSAIHPSVPCAELISDVWCFVLRKGNQQIAQIHFGHLVRLLWDFSSEQSEDFAQRDTRTLARLICALLEVAPESAVANARSLIISGNPFASKGKANSMATLLNEGFTRCMRQDKDGISDFKQLLGFCIAAVKQLVEDQGKANVSTHISKQALICLQLLLEHSFDGGHGIDDTYLQEVASLTYGLIVTDTGIMPNDVVISQALLSTQHIQKLQHNQVETILLRLHKLCHMPGMTNHLIHLKPALAEYLVSLNRTAWEESKENPTIQALWGLYHSVLRDKHWALAHLGLQSFGEFAGNSPCQELWRFLPPDAAVASGIAGGKNGSIEDSFMDSLRSFLEKECAQSTLALFSDHEGDMLKRESRLQLFRAIIAEHEVSDPAKMQVDDHHHKQLVKNALEMVKEGLKSLSVVLPHWLKSPNCKWEDQQWMGEQLATASTQLNILRAPL